LPTRPARLRIFFEDNLCAQHAYGRVGDAIVLVLSEPGSAKEERCGNRVLQAGSGVARPVLTFGRSVRSRISGWPRTTTRSIASVSSAKRARNSRQASITGNSTTPHG
jgi:hypothetical protein